MARSIQRTRCEIERKNEREQEGRGYESEREREYFIIYIGEEGERGSKKPQETCSRNGKKCDQIIMHL